MKHTIAIELISAICKPMKPFTKTDPTNWVSRSKTASVDDVPRFRLNPHLNPIVRALVLSFATIAIGVGFATSASAQSEEATHSGRSVALGTGVRASAASTSALAQNPANLPLTPVYHLESTTAYEPGLGRFAIGGAIVDSALSRIAAGLSFRGLVGGGDNDYGGVDMRAGLAMPVSPSLSIGASLRYVSLPLTLPDGTVANLGKGFTMDASMRVTLLPGLHLAVLGSNLVDRHSALLPVRFGGSVSYTLVDTLTIGADLLFNVSSNLPGAPVLVGGGIEWLSASAVPIRFGYAYDELSHTHYLSGGLGYIDQRVGVDLSLRQALTGENATYLLLGVRYFYDAAGATQTGGREGL